MGLRFAIRHLQCANSFVGVGVIDLQASVYLSVYLCGCLSSVLDVACTQKGFNSGQKSYPVFEGLCPSMPPTRRPSPKRVALWFGLISSFFFLSLCLTPLALGRQRLSVYIYNKVPLTNENDDANESLHLIVRPSLLLSFAFVIVVIRTYFDHRTVMVKNPAWVDALYIFS